MLLRSRSPLDGACLQLQRGLRAPVFVGWRLSQSALVRSDLLLLLLDCLLGLDQLERLLVVQRVNADFGVGVQIVEWLLSQLCLLAEERVIGRLF